MELRSPEKKLLSKQNIETNGEFERIIFDSYLEELIDERKEEALASSYDYYYVPCFFDGNTKLHEGVASKEIIKNIMPNLIKKTKENLETKVSESKFYSKPSFRSGKVDMSVGNIIATAGLSKEVENFFRTGNKTSRSHTNADNVFSLRL